MANPSPHEQLAPILNQRNSGHVDEAIAQLQILLQAHPKFVKGWMELGHSWRMKGDRPQAYTCYRTALEFAPNHLSAHLQLAQELSHLGDEESAQSYLKTAAEKHPKSPLPLVKLGELALNGQELDTALHWFDQAIQRDPTHPAAYVSKVKALRLAEDFTAAAATLDRLFHHHPQHFWGCFHRGKIFQQQGKPDQALPWFRQAHDVAANPAQQRDAQLWILEILQILKHWDEAKPIASELANQWPHHLPTQQRYAAILRNTGETLEAIALYETLLDQQPDRQKLLAPLADCARNLGQTLPEREALKRVEQRVETLWHDRDPLAPLIHCLLRLGERYQQDNDWPTALSYFDRILVLDPDHFWANLKGAIATRNAGDLDSSATRLQQTLKHHPHHPQQVEVLIHLGQTERQRQKFEVALDYLQHAAELKPDRLDIQLKIVEVCRESQQWEQAQTHLQTLQEHYANDPRLLIQQGWLSRQRGQRHQALSQFRLAHDMALQNGNNPAISQQAHWLLIEELRELGQLDVAQQEIETASPEFQQHLRTQLLLGSILQRQQELAPAATIYQQVLQEQPGHVPATLELARCWSQSGQVSEAIALLQNHTAQADPHAGIPHLLGSLHQAQQEFDPAQQAYDRALTLNPRHPGAYCGLAECLLQQGHYPQAIALLTQAQQTLPHTAQLWLKQVQLAQRYGDIDQSFQILDRAQERFPHHVPLRLEHIQLQIRCGQYQEAIALLDTLSTDHQGWRKRMLNQRGEIALLQFNLDQAEKYYEEAIALHPPQQNERMQLARIHLLQGDLDAAYHQLDQATQDLEKKRPPAQVGLPIKNHIGFIINEFWINPIQLAKLEAIQPSSEEGQMRLLAIAAIILEEPTYLGAMILLAKELRLQGIWSEVRTALSIRQPRRAAIPKRMIQFWDDPEPPAEVQQLGQTWLDHNPDYEYQRFSLNEAIAFLQEHYDSDIINAFYLCNHPAAQADFFRLAYLNCYGGFYADADDRCRHSLDPLRQSNADLVLYHEDFACFGNNFLGSIPHHPMIRTALYQAAANLLDYSAESAWSQTGPGLLTTAVCSGLLPYLAYDDYRLWPNLLVLSRGELSHYVWSHIPLSYKKTEKSWQNQAYPKTQFDNISTVKTMTKM